MQRVHNCDKDVHDVVRIFFEEGSNTWWLELGFGSTAIEYCPFCGVNLRDEAQVEQGGYLAIGEKAVEHFKRVLREEEQEE